MTEANDRDAAPRTPRDRLLFWFATALVPGAGMFHIDNPRAMAQRIELIRHYRAQEAENQAPAADQREAA
jgi:hypothetical protein